MEYDKEYFIQKGKEAWAKRLENPNLKKQLSDAGKKGVRKTHKIVKEKKEKINKILKDLNITI